VDIVDYIKKFPLKTFDKDEIVLSPGDANNCLYAIRDGFIKVSSIDDTGRQKLLWIVGRYDMVPIENLFRATDVSYFYTAFGAGSMYVIDKTDFLKTAKQNVNYMAQIAQGLSEHHDNLLARLNSVEQSDLRTKILYVLYNVSVKFDSSSVVKLHDLGLNLTHQDIADMVGATRESTSIELKLMQQEKLIKYSRSSFTVYTDRIAQIVTTPM
jgi:CRP-like cAMP-binding protein